jgi:hypothetical protein
VCVCVCVCVCVYQGVVNPVIIRCTLTEATERIPPCTFIYFIFLFPLIIESEGSALGGAEIVREGKREEKERKKRGKREEKPRPWCISSCCTTCVCTCGVCV